MQYVGTCVQNVHGDPEKLREPVILGWVIWRTEIFFAIFFRRLMVMFIIVIHIKDFFNTTSFLCVYHQPLVYRKHRLPTK